MTGQPPPQGSQAQRPSLPQPPQQQSEQAQALQATLMARWENPEARGHKEPVEQQQPQQQQQQQVGHPVQAGHANGPCLGPQAERGGVTLNGPDTVALPTAACSCAPGSAGSSCCEHASCAGDGHVGGCEHGRGAQPSAGGAGGGPAMQADPGEEKQLQAQVFAESVKGSPRRAANSKDMQARAGVRRESSSMHVEVPQPVASPPPPLPPQQQEQEQLPGGASEQPGMQHHDTPVAPLPLCSSAKLASIARQAAKRARTVAECALRAPPPSATAAATHPSHRVPQPQLPAHAHAPRGAIARSTQLAGLADDMAALLSGLRAAEHAVRHAHAAALTALQAGDTAAGQPHGALRSMLSRSLDAGSAPAAAAAAAVATAGERATGEVGGRAGAHGGRRGGKAGGVRRSLDSCHSARSGRLVGAMLGAQAAEDAHGGGAGKGEGTGGSGGSGALLRSQSCKPPQSSLPPQSLSAPLATNAQHAVEQQEGLGGPKAKQGPTAAAAGAALAAQAAAPAELEGRQGRQAPGSAADGAGAAALAGTQVGIIEAYVCSYACVCVRACTHYLHFFLAGCIIKRPCQKATHKCCNHHEVKP